MAGKPSSNGKVAEITLPLARELPDNFISQHRGRIDMRLDPSHLPAFKRVYAGLWENGATLKNGAHIDSPADVIKYIFEQIAVSEADWT